MADVSVRHNEADHQFEADAGGELAILEYEVQERGFFLAHTFVPAEAQGQGIGESLARAALDYARRKEIKVIPGCTFVRAFIKRHPEYVDVVHPGFRRMVGAEE